ncbi:MAG: hypothetical protein K0Q78_1324 [Cellvibrio sp.]|nr:hypothetical protein [Cellvibrio sp.]
MAGLNHTGIGYSKNSEARKSGLIESTMIGLGNSVGLALEASHSWPWVGYCSLFEPVPNDYSRPTDRCAIRASR